MAGESTGKKLHFTLEPEVETFHKSSVFAHAEKPDIFDEIVDLLRKILDYCLCCLTCGCYARPRDNLTADVYEAELLDEERLAVHNLLKYLHSDDSKKPWISDERLRALCILTYSDNAELQRSASLCFAELSERMVLPITEIVLEPLVVLLRSRDPQVQKAASLAISNFALNGPESNKSAIMNSGALKPLVELLNSPHTEVQCNTCGCITTLATTDRNKQGIVSSGGIRPLLFLAQSTDVRVQRNATGALLNLTHLQNNRTELVEEGALPVLVEALHSSHPDVQYYCAAAISNMAVNQTHRTMMTAIGHYDVIHRLIKLLNSNYEKVKCQACLALRNLASDDDTQLMIVRVGGLRSLHRVVERSRGDTLTAALACLRNLSIHRANEIGIICETFLRELRRVVKDSCNPEAQVHAAGTIRNLAAGEETEAMAKSGCVEALMSVMLSPATRGPVMLEVTAALAVLADEDGNKDQILVAHSGMVYRRLIELAHHSPNKQVQYNCAGIVGQLTLMGIPADLMESTLPSLLAYIQAFLSHSDTSFVHIALWTCLQLALAKVTVFQEAFVGNAALELVQDITLSSHTDAIRELAETVLKHIHQAEEDS